MYENVTSGNNFEDREKLSPASQHLIIFYKVLVDEDF